MLIAFQASGLRLRQSTGLENIFLVALTGNGQENHTERAAGASFDEYVVTPFALAKFKQLMGAVTNSQLKRYARALDALLTGLWIALPRLLVFEPISIFSRIDVTSQP